MPTYAKAGVWDRGHGTSYACINGFIVINNMQPTHDSLEVPPEKV